jgi:pseudaminic acid biosynthesis-associated methylase
VIHGSLLDATPVQAEMALIKGVLIHIAPDSLARAYERLYVAAGRWLVVAEYYNPTPIEVPYRGHSNRLFKRDFAGELLDRYTDLHLVDYGFAYHRGPFPQDDLTWFLLERR